MNKEEYKVYQERVKSNLEGLHAVSTGLCPGCEVCASSRGMDIEGYDTGLEAGTLYDDPSFSNSGCDACTTPLGGDRHAGHALNDENELIHIEVCSDCQYYLEYGQLDDMQMMDMEKEEEEKDSAQALYGDLKASIREAVEDGLICVDDDSVFSFEMEEAIYWYACNYHSGQWSSLYSVLCLSPYKPSPLTGTPKEGSVHELYEFLIEEFEDEEAAV